jgi:hypothetical protein
MKKIIIFCVLFTFANSTQAQLLKKLKDKANKVLEGKKETTKTEPSKEENEGANNNEKGTPKKQQKPDSLACKVIGQLGEGETFLFDETSVIAQNNTVNYSFVIVDKNYQYFLIENGKRTGPFKEAPIKSAKQYGDEEESSEKNDDKVTIGNDDRDPIAIKYTKTIGGKLFIVFNGKNYGSYDYVAKMVVSADKKHFFAIVTIGGENAMTNKMGMGNTFLVSDGTLKQKIGSGTTMPFQFSVSNGFKHCMGTVMDSKTQKMFTVTSTGKQEEANMADMYSDKGIHLVNDNGDIVTVPAASPTQILVNGNEVASFKVPIKKKNNLFLMPDVSKSVYYVKGKLYRPDGTEEKLTGIVFPKVVTINNVTSLYYYKVYKNDAGIKEIYLCKKDL